MDPSKPAPVDWEILAEVIAEGKCVLFLGPGATINYQDKDRQKNFFEQLGQDYKEDIFSYNREDGLFIFSNPKEIDKIQRKIKKFLMDDFSSPMLEKLVQIPFHFVVSLTQDKSFQKEMNRQQFAFKEDYYDVNQEHNPDTPAPGTPPLLYYLLGTPDNTNTIVITHAMMYDFIKAFLGGVKIPQAVKSALNFYNAKHLVFLGVDFDKWYFQLMLNMLGIDAANYSCYALIQESKTGDPASTEKPDFQTIWEKHFKIDFVPHRIDEFVEKIHAIFKARNMLRKAAPPTFAQRKYALEKFFKFFSHAFPSEEFDTFCMSYFEDVYNDFTTNQSKTIRITRLLEFVKKQEQFEHLMGLMKDENPIQYQNFGPYHD